MEKEEELLEALELAKEIIDYCGGGDAWERECAEEARTRFYQIHDKYFPPPLFVLANTVKLL